MPKPHESDSGRHGLRTRSPGSALRATRSCWRPSGVFSMPPTVHAQGDAAAGEKVFAHCAPCHSNKPGENKFGPSLAGVIGRKSGTEPGYNYSSAMKEANVTWDEKEPGRIPPGARQVRPGNEDGLLRADRKRSAGRYRLSEDVDEITCLRGPTSAPEVVPQGRLSTGLPSATADLRCRQD
jgi:hypothetical protein